jgi:hypothetical protein
LLQFEMFSGFAPEFSVNCRTIRGGEIGIVNALLFNGNVRSKAVDFKSYIAATRVGSDKRVPFRGLSLVNSRKPKTDNRQAWPKSQVFSAAEMRHNFAIWALEKSGTSGRQLHLYYCVRCKWAFRVDDRSGSVTPLDSNGNPIQELEAADRLATFGVGPCPVFTRLTGNARVTQVVPPREVLRVRLTALFHAIGRIWKGPNRNAGDDLPRSVRA